MSPIPLGILAASGGAAGAYELIQSQVLSSDVSSVTFSSIPQTYKHLEIRWVARTSVSSTQVEMSLRLNGSTSTYRMHMLRADGSSVFGINDSANAILLSVNGSSAANVFTSGITTLLDYSSSSKNTTVRSLYGVHAGFRRIALESGLFIDTSPITSITLAAGSSTGAESRFSLYGIKG
jgi:hypothetical protein